MRFPDDNQATSWPEAKRLARKKGHGHKIELPKKYAPYLAPDFEESAWSIQGSAKAVYRDQKAEDSFQVREYEDKWTIELDHHNPKEGNALAHAIKDAPGYTIAGLVLAGAAVSGLSG